MKNIVRRTQQNRATMFGAEASMNLSEAKHSLQRALQQPTDDPVRSYHTLRKAVGILGIALPIVVPFAAYVAKDGLQQSISAYYYTAGIGLFVGMLWAIGMFLICYKGHQKIDEVASSLAGAFAIGVSLFPTDHEGQAHSGIGYAHFGFAIAFFLVITYMAVFLFTKSNDSRTRIYRACGVTMVGCLVLMGLRMLPMAGILRFSFSLFTLEAIAVVAFGVAWLVKGLDIGKPAPPDDARVKAMRA
jgi:hypothetical protein